jgi:hypothetical protein
LIPILLKVVTLVVSLGSFVISGAIGIMDFIAAILATIFELLGSALAYWVTHINFWEGLGGTIVAGAEEATGIGFIIAAVGFGIGLACILYEWNKAAND